MAPKRPAAPLLRGALVPALLLAALFAPAPAHALRIVNYNVLNYPGTTGSVRNPHLRTVLGPLGADVLACQEMQSQAGVDSIRLNVLNVLEPGQWASAPFLNGNDTDNALFYKPSKVELLGHWGFYPNPANLLRLVMVYRLRPAGYTNVEFRIYSQHLKASSGSANEAQRLAEAIGIRDSMNAVPPGTHAMLMGDFNIYTGAEAAFVKLLESQADNDGRLYDPQNLPAITWNTASLASYHTQSPCLSGGALCANGAATGGMDDRFDMLLPTFNWNDGEGLDLVPGTYVPVGNDGGHFNLNITDSSATTGYIDEGPAYANALIKASDHLPVRVDVQLPSKIGVAGGPLAFGTVIEGATATGEVQVSNPAIAPVDELTYSLLAPAGFTVGGGPFQSIAEAAGNQHAVTMLTDSAGVKVGTLVVSTDAPDDPTVNVALSGTVLRHSAASLDSLVAAAAATLDFGVQDPGLFGPLEARAHNLGYGALQARLQVTAATITGGEGRFSLVSGTAPTLLAGVGETFTVAFDDAGATRDSLYEATLVIDSEDEALPGATNLPDLVVTLQAKLTPDGTTGVGGGAPRAFAFYPPSPNPSRGSTTIGFDLPARAPVDLAVFDLSGRRIATLARGVLEADRHRVSWNGSGDGGRALPAGLYFVRLTAMGQARTARFALLR